MAVVICPFGALSMQHSSEGERDKNKKNKTKTQRFDSRSCYNEWTPFMPDTICTDASVDTFAMVSVQKKKSYIWMKLMTKGKQHLPKPASTPSEFAQNCHSIAPAATAFCASFDLNTLFDSRTIAVELKFWKKLGLWMKLLQFRGTTSHEIRPWWG